MLFYLLFLGMILAQTDDKKKKDKFIPAILGENDGEFDDYIISWETESFIDPSIPIPTNS